MPVHRVRWCATTLFRETLREALRFVSHDQMHIPIKNAWQLNERHYGGLTGLDKQETVEKHGKEQVSMGRQTSVYGP